MSTTSKTAEEILDNHLTYLRKGFFNPETVQEILAAMKEYASQSLSTHPVTEDEIEKMAEKYSEVQNGDPRKYSDVYQHQCYESSKEDFIAGYKAAHQEKGENCVTSDNTMSSDRGDAPFKANATIEQGWRNLPFFEEYLCNREWMPDLKFMSQKAYDEQMSVYNDAAKKVVFTNTYVGYESCDCGDGYGCSHGSWPYEIRVFDESRKNCLHRITYEDAEQLIIQGETHCITLNKIYTNLTLGDFYDYCKLAGITLLLNKQQEVQVSDTTGVDSSNSAKEQK